MLAKFPECNDGYKNPAVEDSMAAATKIIKSCRSVRTSYNIANNQLTKFYLRVSGDMELFARDQTDDIMTLGKGSSVDINPEDNAVPKSVSLVVIDDQTTLLMDLTGLVDFNAEIAKLEKSLKETTPALTSLEKKIAAPGYEANVKEELKVANVEKLAGLKKKVSDIEEAIENFKKLAELEQK
jgi:valyl-tRNA synthetase